MVVLSLILCVKSMTELIIMIDVCLSFKNMRPEVL